MDNRAIFLCCVGLMMVGLCVPSGRADERDAETALGEALSMFSDTKVSRKDLLVRFQKIATDHPTGKHVERVFRSIDLLQRMVAEDDARARKPPPPEKKMTKRELIADLIFRLRDQQGWQWSWPGTCDIFQDPLAGIKHNKTTPAHRLVALGYDAVPQLIEALEDERFSRAIQSNRFDTYVLRIGDCALAIVERIAGRHFKGTGPLEKGKGTSNRKAVEVWWREFRKKGEKQMLIEGAAAGDWDSPEQAQRLLARYPAAAFDPIARGVRQSKNGWSRSALLNIAGEIKGDRPVALFREELKAARPRILPLSDHDRRLAFFGEVEGPTLASRQAAARNLLTRGNDEGVAVMIAEWKKFDGSEDLDDGYYDHWSPENMVEFLALCDRRAAIEALAAGLREHPIDHRLMVISACEKRTRLGDGKPLSREVQEIMDGLLVQCLDDEEEQFGRHIGDGDKSCSDPRVCDLAGRALAEVWKKPDLFDLFNTPQTRDRQRFELTNLWRKKQGKPPLPLPAPWKVAALPEEKVHPLCEAVLAAKTERERRAALGRLGDLGLPAVPALRNFLAKAPAKHPARTDLEALLVRLASTVSEVRFADDSVRPGKKVRQAVERWKGRPLTSADAVGLLISACSVLPQGAGGVRVTVRRPGDDTGSMVRVCLTRARRGKSPIDGWSTNEFIEVNGEGVHGVWSSLPGGNPRPLPEPDHWEEFVRRLDEKVRDTRASVSILLECRGQ